MFDREGERKCVCVRAKRAAAGDACCRFAFDLAHGGVDGDGQVLDLHARHVAVHVIKIFRRERVSRFPFSARERERGYCCLL